MVLSPRTTTAQLDLRERLAAHDERIRQHGGQQAADPAWSQYGDLAWGETYFVGRL